MNLAPEPVAAPRPPLLHRATRRQLQLLDLCVAGALAFAVGVHGLLLWRGGETSGPQLAVVGMWALAAGSIALRRRSAAVALALMTGAVVIGLVSRTSSVALLVAFPMYEMAATRPRRHSLAAVGAELVTLAILAVVTSPPGNPHDASGEVGAAVIAVAFWFVGDSVRVRRVYVAGLAEQAAQRQREALERAQRSVAEERLQIARELHDVVAHSLSVITIQAGVGRHVIDVNTGEARHALAAVEETSRAALDELRRMLGVLRGGDPSPAELRSAPGVAALPRLVEQVRATGIAVSLELDSELSRSLSPAAELSVYRIVQEALTNVVKHAGPASAQVLLHDEPGTLVLEVLDDGPGVPVPTPPGPAPAAAAHHGLVGMRERVALFGGSFAAGPRAGGGFAVHARFPAARVLAA